MKTFFENFRRSTLKRKLVVFMMVAGIAPGIYGLSFTYLNVRDIITKQSTLRLEHKAELDSVTVQYILEKKVAEIRRIAAWPGLKTALQEREHRYLTMMPEQIKTKYLTSPPAWNNGAWDLASSEESKRISSYFKDFLRSDRKTHLTAILVDSQGVLLSATDNNQAYFHKHKQWFNRTKNLEEGSTYVEGPSSDKPGRYVIHATAPVLDPSTKKVIGMLRLTFSLSNLLNPLLRNVDRNDGQTHVVRSDGTLIIGLKNQPLMTKFNKAVVNGVRNKRKGHLLKVMDDHDKEVMLAYSRVQFSNNLISKESFDNDGWYVLITLPLTQNNILLNALMLRLALPAILVLTALAFLWMWITNRLILNPVALLKSGAEKFGAGDFLHRIPVDTGDELEQVAKEFNSMATKVHEAHTYLELKVLDRTQELQASEEELRAANEELVSLNKEMMSTLDKLNQSENKYRNLFEQSYDAIILADPETLKIIEANNKAVRLTGYEREELTGLTLYDLHPAEQKTTINEFVSTLQREGFVRADNLTVYRKDGEQRNIDFASTLVDYGGQRLVQRVMRDITERVQAEQELKRRAGELSTLYSIATILGETFDADKLLQESLRHVLAFVNEKRGFIFLKDMDSSLKCVAWQGFDDSFISGIEKLHLNIESFLYAKEPWVGLTERMPEALPHLQPLLKEAGAIKSGVFPLVAHDELLGFLTICSEKENAFPTHEEQVLSSIAHELAVATESCLLFHRISIGERQWQDTFDAISDWVVIVDENLNIVKANRASSEITGYEPAQLIGMKCYKVLHEKPDEGEDACPSALTFKTGQPNSAEISVINNRQYKLWSYPIIHENKVIAVVEYAHDVTEAKHLEAQLLQSAKLAAIGELAANIAHEINNPLTGILGYTSLLMDSFTEDDERREDLKIIESEAIRARGIVRGLLDFSRQTEPFFEKNNINEVLRATINLLKHQAKVNSIDLLVEYGDELPLVEIDTNQIKQVFLNILNNGFQAMPDGGTMKVVSRLQGSNLVVEFQDSGGGIDPENINRIFEPFFTTKGEVKGTGLGLSVSYGIIQRHGGRLEVESNKGLGALFRILFPLTKDTSYREPDEPKEQVIQENA